MASDPHKPARDLPDVHETHGRDSVTDVNGTIARFEMSYSPPKKEKAWFGAPLRQRVPSLVLFGAAAVFAIVVLLAYASPDANGVFAWIIETDRGRPFSSQVLSGVILACAAGIVLRAHMRGVSISRDWIVVRTLLPLGIPQSKRWGWPQVNRVVVDKRTVALELMDTSFNPLPPVNDHARMRDLLLAHAIKKNIQITLLDDSVSKPRRDALESRSDA